MPWAPNIAPNFIRPVIKNLTAYFRAYSADALAYFAPPAPVPAPFKHFGMSERIDDTLFPLLLVLAVGTDFEIGPESMSVNESHEIIVQISNVGPDPDALADDIFIRENAVTSMCAELTGADLFEGVNMANISPFVVK